MPVHDARNDRRRIVHALLEGRISSRKHHASPIPASPASQCPLQCPYRRQLDRDIGVTGSVWMKGELLKLFMVGFERRQTERLILTSAILKYGREEANATRFFERYSAISRGRGGSSWSECQYSSEYLHRTDTLFRPHRSQRPRSQRRGESSRAIDASQRCPVQGRLFRVHQRTEKGNHRRWLVPRPVQPGVYDRAVPVNPQC